MKPILRFIGPALILLASCKGKDKTTRPVQINRDSTTISYTLCGKGDTTLLFIHGWGINKTYWDGQAQKFCDRYRVVTVDLPGFGSSGRNRARWDFDNYAKDINTVIESLGLKKVVLIGHSMSGDIVLAMSAKYPEKIAGIIGIDNLHEPGGPMTEEEKKQADEFFSTLTRSFDSVVNTSMKGILFQPSTDTAVVSRVLHDIETSDRTIAISVLRSLAVTGQEEKQVMQQLHHKLYLINSDVLPVKADSLNKYCRYGFSLQTVHGTGHYPMIEKPDEFNAALERTLAGISHDQKN